MNGVEYVDEYPRSLMVDRATVSVYSVSARKSEAELSPRCHSDKPLILTSATGFSALHISPTHSLTLIPEFCIPNLA